MLNNKFGIEMKKIVILAILVVVSYGYTSSQTSGAVIRFDKTAYDYGTIYQNSDGSCEFVFYNDGDEPLVLSNVKSSCGCTIPNWPKEPVLPSQSGVIKVSYDTKRIGLFQKQITVSSNATESTVVLNIKGNVVAKPQEVLPEKEINQGFTPTAN